jgi:hypothetical protein
MKVMKVRNDAAFRDVRTSADMVWTKSVVIAERGRTGQISMICPRVRSHNVQFQER